MKTALTIAGFDPTGGAGVQMDIKVFNHFGVYGLSVVSALTAQNTFEIRNIIASDKKCLEEQLFTIISDIRPDALKTGMLFSKDAVSVVAKAVKGFDLQNLVVDPVTVSTTGTALLKEGVLDFIMNELFPLAKVITPNIYEASVLSGIAIEDVEDMRRASEELKKTGAENIIITGGHFEKYNERNKLDRAETLDLMYDGVKFHSISGRKIKGEYHGTGCAFSAAITALLAREASVEEALKRTREFISFAVENAYNLGKGMRLLNI